MLNSWNKGEILSLILAIIGLITWIIPLAGLPVNAAALILALRSLRSKGGGPAKIAAVMSSVGLTLSFATFFYGVYFGLRGGPR